MGIVEKKLEEFYLGETEYIIELNRGDIIHIHMDEFRLDMTTSEFEEFVRVIKEAKEKLVERKCLK